MGKVIECTESDRESIIDFLSAEPEMNLFLYGDLESFGACGEHTRFYRFGDWDALMVRHYGNFCLAVRNDGYDAAAVASFLRGQALIDGISGKESAIIALKEYYPLSFRSMSLCSLRDVDGSSLHPLESGESVVPLGVKDIPEIFDLLLGIDEFGSSYPDQETVMRKKVSKADDLAHGGMMFGLRKDGILVSIAGTSAASGQSAMVVSVATRKECRGKGYASRVIMSLCKANLEEGRQFLCLCYDNPAAGRIYRRLGFRPVGKYAIGTSCRTVGQTVD